MAQGFEYSRSGNPNRQALEATLAALEAGGADAIAFSSGSAVTATLVQAVGPNAHILSVNDVYGGTARYLKRVASEIQTLETSFVDLEGANDDTILAACQPNTKVRYSYPLFLLPHRSLMLSDRRIPSAYLDRITHKPDASARGYTPDRRARTIAPLPTARGRR